MGATLTRSLDDVTGSTPAAPESLAPNDGIVRYGSEAAGNVIGLVVSGARAGPVAGARAGRAAGTGGRAA